MNILVVMPVQPQHVRLLRESAPDAEFLFASPEQVSRDQAEWADVIIGNLKPSLLKESKRLRLMQLNSAGTDGYIGALPEGAALTNASGAYGLAISEHMLGMMLMLLKHLHQYRDNQKHNLWKDMGNVSSVEGTRVLVVGLGDIGGDFARKAHALGAYTIGIRRTLSDKPDYLDELHQLDQLDNLLPDADVVALSLPGTPQTQNLFSKERIARMKRGAILLNVGRGSAVDTEALCDAVLEGRLGGAGLDVTQPEPLPADHRMWGIENILITPHISGNYHLQQTHDRIVQIAAENIRRLIKGEEFINIVDFSTGYRKRQG